MKTTLNFLAMISFSAVATFAQPAPSASPATSVNGGGGKPSIVLPPEKSQPVKMPRFEKPPVIDGKLDDEVWKKVIILKDFYQVQPGDNIAPSKPTEVMLGYDAKFIYIAFHCYDEPDKVRATIAKRDNIFNDDHKAYVFDINQVGIQ